MFLGDDFNIDSGLKITRQKFEELCHPFITRSISIVKRTLVKAKLSAKQVNEVIRTFCINIFISVSVVTDLRIRLIWKSDEYANRLQHIKF